MRPSIPALIATAFATVAAGLLGLGTWLAQRETEERVVRDRGAHEQLASELGAELRRLEERYEAHLRALWAQGENGRGPGFVAACRNIVGVRHFSRLHEKPSPRDLQLDCRAPGALAVEAPVFPGGALFASIPRREMAPEQFFGRASPAGTWLREAGRPALCFREHAGAVEVFSIDETEVREAIDGWMARWLAAPFSAIAGETAEDRVVAPGRRAVVSAGAASAGPPDWVLPVPSQFGTWRIESWDQRARRRHWHAPTLAAAAGAAVLVLGIGLALAARARSERRLAEQRVSFVNRVSHELRAPLTNILLNLDLAAEAEGAPGRRIALAREEAGRLGRLIDNVLTFSRAERGRLDLHPRACAPAAVIEKVLEQFGPAFQRRGITAQFVNAAGAPARPCLTDPDALAQIVANLLSNVEKYVPGGSVELTVRHDESDLCVRVADHGPGIPAAAASRAFLPFERLDSRITEGATGTGLGLAIARDLATRLGGTLRLLPSPAGATFELQIPAPSIPELRASSAA